MGKTAELPLVKGKFLRWKLKENSKERDGKQCCTIYYILFMQLVPDANSLRS
jgi:hypothetical protein